MGFYGPTIILNDDVQISGTFTYDEKISDIGEYLEGDGYEVITPTTEICKYFKDKIKYTLPSIKCFCVLNNRLEVWNQLPNLHVFTSKNDVIEYLEDTSKIYYLVKVSKTTAYGLETWSLYVFEKSNISNLRENKINKILDENNSM